MINSNVNSSLTNNNNNILQNFDKLYDTSFTTAFELEFLVPVSFNGVLLNECTRKVKDEVQKNPKKLKGEFIIRILNSQINLT